MEKYNKLVEFLKQYNKICIAYSGGVDSTLLLKAAQEAVGDNAFAVVADIIYFARRDIIEAVDRANEMGAKCYVINVDTSEMPQITYNEHNRCYHCKYTVFSSISKVASIYGTKVIMDGRIVTDSTEYRPGYAATRELGIISPLEECGFYKEDVREISKELGLATWNKASNTCLATRFPYETEITREKLSMVEEGEFYIRGLGVGVLRLRTHEDVARIEVSKEDFNIILDNAADITNKLKDLGYNYVSLDLSSYKSGSMDI